MTVAANVSVLVEDHLEREGDGTGNAGRPVGPVDILRASVFRPVRFAEEAADVVLRLRLRLLPRLVHSRVAAGGCRKPDFGPQEVYGDEREPRQGRNEKAFGLARVAAAGEQMDELREKQRQGAGDGGEQEAAEDFPADEDCVSGNVLVGKKPPEPDNEIGGEHRERNGEEEE